MADFGHLRWAFAAVMWAVAGASLFCQTPPAKTPPPKEHMASEFRSGAAKASVIEIQGASHYLFRTHEKQVVREILSFLERLGI